VARTMVSSCEVTGRYYVIIKPPIKGMIWRIEALRDGPRKWTGCMEVMYTACIWKGYVEYLDAASESDILAGFEMRRRRQPFLGRMVKRCWTCMIPTGSQSPPYPTTLHEQSCQEERQFK
jgi:hypothetical protein